MMVAISAAGMVGWWVVSMVVATAAETAATWGDQRVDCSVDSKVGRWVVRTAATMVGW